MTSLISSVLTDFIPASRTSKGRYSRYSFVTTSAAEKLKKIEVCTSFIFDRGGGSWGWLITGALECYLSQNIYEQFPSARKDVSNYYPLSFQNVFRLLIPNYEVSLGYLVTSPPNHLATKKLSLALF